MGLRGKDKHPRDEKRRQNKVSQRKKRKIKESYKDDKKDNYKKKDPVVHSVECSICFNTVSNTSDNSVKCGKTIHFICGECKFRCNETGNDKCPMCRSHPIRNPIARDIMLPVIEIGERLKKPTSPYKFMHFSPKERRLFNKSQGRLIFSFNHNSNRIVRERRIGRSGIMQEIWDDRGTFREYLYDSVPFGWRQWEMRGGWQSSEGLARRYIPGWDPESDSDDDDDNYGLIDIPIWTRIG
jgi:hypothetical protein